MRIFAAVITLLCIQTTNYATDTHIKKYLEFLKEHAHLAQKGSYKNGEIEIVLDPARIAAIEDLQKARCIKQGYSEKEAHRASRVGEIERDQYWSWIRDPVVFPTGAEGTYDRIVLHRAIEEEMAPGVAVLPVLPDGKIVLNIQYRHAIRAWELEVPRGFRQAGESIEDAARRELEEETGFQVGAITKLGDIVPDSGALSTVAPVYLGRISKQGFISIDFSEAISGTRAFTLAELKKAIAEGFVEMEIQEQKQKVHLRDSFLTFALFQAEYKKLV